MKPPKPLIHEHPFEPAIIPDRMVWTSSSLKTFRRCKRMFFWKYMMRLRPRGRGAALLIGSAAHEALEQWYKGRRSSMTKIAERMRAEAEKIYLEEKDYFNQKDIEKADQGLQMFVGMMEGYDAIYKHERDEWDIDPANIERKFSADMGDFDFNGKCDLIASQDGKWFLVEHKTAATIPDSYIERLPLDTQVKAYIFGAREVMGLPIKDVVYDVIKKSKKRRKANETHKEFTDRIKLDYMASPGTHFHREPLLIDSEDIRAFVHDLHATHAEYLHILDTRDPTDPRSWPMNDHAYTEFFSISPFSVLSNQGLDKGTAMLFTQEDAMHVELEEEN